MKTLTLIILTAAMTVLCCSNSTAQPTNFHGGVSLGAGPNNTLVGGTAGVDIRAGRFAFSLDGSVERAWKDPYEPGVQFNGRQTIRWYAGKRFFLQGGAVEHHHRFDRFTKTTIEPLVGLGVENTKKDQLFGLNYRHDVTSENSQRVAEAWYQAFSKKHLYMRMAGGATSYLDGSERKTSAFFRAEVGLWFK